MTQRFQRVCDLFEEARHLPAGAERDRFLAERCDADVRDEVATMLAHHEESADADSIVAVGPALDDVWADQERARGPAPERIGPYRILSELGAGGSGTVYLAEQDSPKRQVALKVLNALSPAARERFEREGEILGQLEHEGIARVYSVEGTAIAMELVEGVPLTRYADERALSVRARLELLRKVCEIVAHAHHRGVIHRDLKPSNILVTPAGQPKVLDFGLARRTEDEGQTMTGLVMGTLAYMSPEQANAQPGEVDTRTDVYALGVLAYELLSGRTPHRTEGRPVTEVLREIGQGDIEALPVGGDVALIVHRALAREKERRYQSAGALAEDLERFLNHEPIVARSPTATYLLKKFVRRHKALVGAACAVVLALAVGLVFALRFAREADRNARAAARATARARVEAAAAALRQGQPWHVARHLAEVPPEHRGWEWRYLQGRLDTSVTHLPLPAGRAFDLEDAALWADPAWRPWLFALRPAGLRSDGNTVVDVRTGRALGIGAKGVTWVDATPDGSIVAVAGDHRRGEGVLVLDRRSNEEVAFVETRIHQAFLSPDGRLVACAHSDETLEVVRLADGESRRMLHGHYQHPYAAAFTPDGRFVATGTVDRDVRVHDWAAGKTVRTLRRHGSSVYGLAYSADGRHLASASDDRTVVVWDVEAGTGTSFLGHTDRVRAVGFRDGRLFSIGYDGLRTWDRQRSRDVLRHHRGRDEGNPFPYIYGVAFAPDGRTVVSAGWDHTARVSDVATGRLLRTIETRGACYAAGFAGAEMLLAGRGFIGAKHASADRIAVRPGGREFATSYAYGRSAHVFDARTLEPSGWTGFEKERFYDVAYSPDGAYLALAADGSVSITDADTGRLVRELKGHEGRVRSVAYHPDGRILASGGADRTIVLWDAHTGARLRMLEGHVAKVYTLAFHPDGRRLASGSNDSTIRLWDPDTGAEVLELRGHTSYVYDLAWSPDGTVLASASGDNTVRLWRG